MKHIAMALIALAWLITTDKVVEIKAINSTTYGVTYETYCTTQKNVSADAKGRYKVDQTGGVVYVPVGGSKVEAVTKCP